MEQKVSAKELMDVVRDTNKKITAITNGQLIKAKKQTYSAFGTGMAIFFIVLGVALAVAAIFQHVAGEDITFFLLKTEWKMVYVGYAIVTIFMMSIARIHPAVRLIVLLAAIAPLCIILLVPIF